MSKSVLHKANTRGQTNHGWLNSHHTFSFANYYNPERMNFGVRRIGEFENGSEETYQLKDSKNGVYAFVLEGEVNIEGQDLGKRDGFGVWDTDSIRVRATKDAKVLLMDVPMQLN